MHACARQLSLSCLLIKICFWWFSQARASHPLCSCQGGLSTHPAVGLGPRGQHHINRGMWTLRVCGGVQPWASAGRWGGLELRSRVSEWNLERARALPAGGTQLSVWGGVGCVSILPVVAPPLPYKTKYWHGQVRMGGCLYRLIVKAIHYGGGLVS